MLAQPLERLGESDAALHECDKAFKLSGGNTHPLAVRAYILAATGRAAQSREIAKLMEKNSAVRFVPAYNIALAYAGLGDHAATYQWLDRALEERDVHVVFLTADPKWDFQRAHPRFVDVLQRAGIAGESPA